MNRKIWKLQNWSSVEPRRLISLFGYLQMETEISKYFFMSIDAYSHDKLVETHQYLIDYLDVIAT